MRHEVAELEHQVLAGAGRELGRGFASVQAAHVVGADQDHGVAAGAGLAVELCDDGLALVDFLVQDDAVDAEAVEGGLGFFAQSVGAAVDDKHLAAFGINAFEDAQEAGAGGVQRGEGQAGGATEAVVAGGFELAGQGDELLYEDRFLANQANCLPTVGN